MKYEALSMSIPSSIMAPASSDIMDFLSLITPEKKQWWSRADRAQVLVNLQPPFKLRGFDSLNDTDLIEADIESIIPAIKKHFGLDEVAVSPSSGRRGDFDGIVLSPGEARLLYEGVKGGSFEDIRYVYIFVGSQRIHSVFRVKVPGDSKINDVVSFLENEGKIGNPDAPEEHSCIFNPLSSRLFNPEEPIGPETSYLAFSNEEKRLDSAGLFSRPSLRIKPVFRDVSPALDSERPCCNCLSCASVCPAGLAPNILYHFERAGSEDTEAMGADLCFHCGLCTFICPSNIPLCAGIGAGNADSE